MMKAKKATLLGGRQYYFCSSSASRKTLCIEGRAIQPVPADVMA